MTLLRRSSPQGFVFLRSTLMRLSKHSQSVCLVCGVLPTFPVSSNVPQRASEVVTGTQQRRNDVLRSRIQASIQPEDLPQFRGFVSQPVITSPFAFIGMLAKQISSADLVLQGSTNQRTSKSLVRQTCQASDHVFPSLFFAFADWSSLNDQERAASSWHFAFLGSLSQ
jgi:hypothetical protein